MTYAIDAYPEFRLSGRIRRSRRWSPVGIVGQSFLASIALAGVCLLIDRPNDVRVASPSAALALLRTAASASGVPEATPSDPALALALSAIALGQTAPLDATFTASLPDAAAPEPVVAQADEIVPATPADASPLVQNEAVPEIPLPALRPPEFGSRPTPVPFRAPRQFARRSAPLAAPADNRSFFEKLFGSTQPAAGPALAYAAPEDGLVRRPLITPPMATDRSTAIYDISARTVFMPDGTRLEAHSGLGSRLDDPRFVHERSRGPTPPQTYDLALRERLFHGVRALRLNPVGGGGTYGRNGLLAHTFMLGPNGDSNGCVSFRNYEAFLQAYLNGQVRRLAVVASR